MNASDKVHFYVLDKKTEGNKSEIKEAFHRISDYIEKKSELIIYHIVWEESSNFERSDRHF